MKRELKFKRHIAPYAYLTLEERAGVAPERGMCSIFPALRFQDALICANGTLTMLVYGDPLHERIIFNHERLLIPRWKDGGGPRPPQIADVLPEVRRLEREGRFTEAANLSLETARSRGDAVGTDCNRHHPAFVMELEHPRAGLVKGYLRTLDFLTGEAEVHWEDERGRWRRRCFVSRPDQAAVQLIAAPPEGKLDLTLRLVTNKPLDTHSWELGQMPDNLRITRFFEPRSLLLEARYDEELCNAGYAVATRVITKGGHSKVLNGELVVTGADSVLLLTRVERCAPFEEGIAEQLADSLLQLEENYDLLLARHSAYHSAIMRRCELKLSVDKENLMSVEELLAQQHSDRDLSAALLEKLFDMGRYYLLTDTGMIPPTYGHTNINVNLQVCSGNLADLPECMEVFFSWIESMLDQFRENARNIFGARGILADIHPDAENGLLTHFDFNWPHHYWISAAGWIYNEFWGHYLVTGDKKFLAERIIPGLKEIALFYEDFLTDVDEEGNYIFYPSYSPENWPENTGCMTSINACMDIMVCREVLENLLEGLRILGMEDEKVPVWQSILSKLPPYLLDEEGALKEWAWPSLEERYNHRHVSHHYDVWPGNAITWEDTPELARAVLLSNRKRGQQDDSAHGIMHRAFTAARLKDSADVYFNLKQILEHGFVNRSLMTNHYPYNVYFPDALGALPAFFIEMLVYSRPGVIELLPALPREIPQGRLSGVRCFTFARLQRLTWDRRQGWIEADILSLEDQEIFIHYRHGLASMTVDGTERELSGTGCKVQILAGMTVFIKMRLRF